MMHRWKTALAAAMALVCTPAAAEEPGLLFHLSAERALVADTAAGDAEPHFVEQVAVREGRDGHYIEASDRQVLAWSAPGNIYSERGTLSFYWRARHPVGETEFPIFRVGYADHTSWDMTWLRIDWNGEGYDAFVTDADLARLRVSFRGQPRPAPDQWVHFTLAWDEATGIRFYVDGRLAGQVNRRAMLDAGLSFFGPHSRIISGYQVQSAYNFLRGGDVDEIRIYDRMLDASQVGGLARGQAPTLTAAAARDDAAQSAIWRRRFGFEAAPPYLSEAATTIRRVEFSDAKDSRQWIWRGNDGIRETTWPGVYNLSRLEGRTDYFVLPDWNVYSFGGRAITYTLPDEPWNRLEIQGAAAGRLTLGERGVGRRRAGQERTTHALAESRGGAIRFDNDVPETPIQEIGAYYVHAAAAPRGSASLSYVVRTGAGVDYPELDEVNQFIAGRFAADERASVVALPAGAPVRPARAARGPALPIVHVLIPYDFRYSRNNEGHTRFTYGWSNMNAGLDGIEITLPALDVRAVSNGLYPINIRVKDPLWPARDLMDVNVSVRPGEARTLFLDTRDRVLPDERSLYLAIAGAGPGLSAEALDGMAVRLVFKPRAEAAAEHVHDRFQQVRDNWGFIIEEHPYSRRLPAFERTYRDVSDLLRIDPTHVNGRAYWNELMNNSAPSYAALEPVADGVPVWAARQAESLRLSRSFIQWWIDNRLVDGEFGGGLSDDSDFANQFIGLNLMGADPEPLVAAHNAQVEAIYRQGMFTDGLSTIQTDELHSYEEGINSNAQAMYMEWGDPVAVEHLMETARALPRILETNPAGHRHFVSSYFGGNRISRESVWEWSRGSSYLMLHPAMQLVEFNNDPATRQILLELADGYLAHGRQDASGAWTFPQEINWRTDEGRGTAPERTIQLMWAAYRWTGDEKYLRPIQPGVAAQLGPADVIGRTGREQWRAPLLARVAGGDTNGFALAQAFRLNGDISLVERLHTDEVQRSRSRMYVVTEGHMWSDRVDLPTDNLQRMRLGGVALVRNIINPNHVVSWRFAAPARADSVGILVREGSANRLRIQVYNLETSAVTAEMTGWDVTAGRWRLRTGADANGDGTIDGAGETREVMFARSAGVPLAFAPRANTVIEMELIEAAASLPSSRPDVGIGPPDVRRSGGAVSVTVHSLGSVEAPAGRVVVEDAAGREIAAAPFAAIAPPLDLTPKTRTVRVALPRGFAVAGHSVRLELDGGAAEITQMNNRVALN